ncbi:toll/interleukin-1 receptor domain-containing protein [Azospirillum doebereinerae]
MAKLFISYSHKDENLRQELEVQLAMLRRQGLVEIWHDRRIVAGDAVDDTISQHLEEADVILLLLSPDFLASNYCYERETARALERHAAGEARVIPVILRPCDWMHPPLNRLLAAPTDGRPVTRWPDKDEAMLEVARAIRTAIGALEASGTPRRPAAPAARATATAPPSTTTSGHPRSSNLRIRQEFTDRDRHVFMEQAFEFMANFFENSLEELGQRNPGIETSFRRIDANHVSAAIFRSGKRMSACRIWLGGIGGRFGGDILFAYNDTGSDNSWNESVSVDADSQSLYLRPTGMASYMGANHDSRLTAEGAAELFWGMLIQSLQG